MTYFALYDEYREVSCALQQVNGFEPYATPEQIESLETLREYMISSKGPLRDPSGLSSSGLSEGQLSEAAQFFLTNLERLLHANKIAATEVIDTCHMMPHGITWCHNPGNIPC